MTPDTTEIWKWIKGYENRYQISNHGRVLSWVRKGPDQTKMLEIPNLIRLQIGSTGYYYFNMKKPGDKRRIGKIHILVAKHFLLPPPFEGAVVNHLDLNKLNNRADNLQWTTHKGNRVHAAVNGSSNTVLDEIKIDAIMVMCNAGMPSREIGYVMGISTGVVKKVIIGWKLMSGIGSEWCDQNPCTNVFGVNMTKDEIIEELTEALCVYADVDNWVKHSCTINVGELSISNRYKPTHHYLKHPPSTTGIPSVAPWSHAVRALHRIKED